MARVIRLDWDLKKDSLEESKKAWGEIREEIEKAEKVFNEFTEHNKKVKDLTKSVKGLNAEIMNIGKGTKELEKFRKVINQTSDSTAKLGNRIKDVGTETKTSGENIKNIFKNVREEINKTTKSQKNLENAVNKTAQAYKQAADQASKMPPPPGPPSSPAGDGGVKSGKSGGKSGIGSMLQGLSGSMNQAASETVGFDVSSLSQVAEVAGSALGPYGALAAATVAAGVAFAGFANTLHNEVYPQISLVKGSFSTIASEDIPNVTAKIQTLSQTFGVEFTDTARFMNEQMVTFGLSADQASERFQFLAAALPKEKLTENLDWAREYDVQLAKLGFTAEEMGNILVNSFDAGVYNDKALDAVKEFGIEMNQLSTSKEKVIKDAGLFKYFEQMRTGSITVKQGMTLLNEELKKMEAQGKDITPLATAIFGSPGEDMGNDIRKLMDMAKGVSDTRKAQIDAEMARQKEVLDQTEQANMAMNEFVMSMSSTVTEGQHTWTIFYQSVREVFYKLMSGISDTFGGTFSRYIDAVKGQINALLPTLQLLATVFGGAIMLIVAALLEFSSAVTTYIVTPITWVVGVVSKALLEVIYWFGKLFGVLENDGSRAISDIQNTFSSFFSWITNAIKIVVDWFNSWGDSVEKTNKKAKESAGIFTTIGNAISWLVGLIGEGISAFFDWDNAISVISGSLSALGTLFYNVAKNAYSLITLDFSGFAKGVMSTFVGVGDAYSKTAKSVSKKRQEERNAKDAAEDAKESARLLAQREKAEKERKKREEEEKKKSKPGALLGSGGGGAKKDDKSKEEEEKKLKAAFDKQLAQYQLYIDDRKNKIDIALAEELITQEEANIRKLEIDREMLDREMVLKTQYKQIEANTEIEHTKKLNNLNKERAIAQIAADRADATKRNEERKKNLDKELKDLQDSYNRSLLFTKKDASEIGEVVRGDKERQLTNEAEFEKSKYLIKKQSLQEMLKEEHLTNDQRKSLMDELLAHEKEYANNSEKLNSDLAQAKYEKEKKFVNDIKALRQGRMDTLVSTLTSSSIAPIKNMGNIIGLVDKNKSAQADLDKRKQEATAIGGDKGKKLAKEIDKEKKLLDITNKLAVAGEIANGLANTASMIQQLRLNGIEKEIQLQQANTEIIKEQLELERERNESIFQRAEFENSLVEQRVNELEDLSVTIPEAEKARLKEQIALEKSKIKDVEKMRKEASKREEEILKEEEKKAKILEDKKKAIQFESFEIERASNITQTIIAGAVAAVQAYATLGPIAGAIAAALIGGFSAAQVGIIASQPNPYAFAEGTLSVTGGEHGKDSVHALLMPGEAVIPVDRNKEYADVISAVYHRSIPAEAFREFIDGMKTGNYNVGKNFAIGQSAYYDTEILSKRIVEAIQSKPVVSLNIDSDGINTYIEEVNNRKKILNRKLRMK